MPYIPWVEYIRAWQERWDLACEEAEMRWYIQRRWGHEHALEVLAWFRMLEVELEHLDHLAREELRLEDHQRRVQMWEAEAEAALWAPMSFAHSIVTHCKKLKPLAYTPSRSSHVLVLFVVHARAGMPPLPGHVVVEFLRKA